MSILLNDENMLTIGLAADAAGLYADSMLWNDGVVYVTWDDAFAILTELALRYLDAGFVAIVTSFSMVVSGVISVLVGMDTFSWALCIGGVICLGAVILSSLPQRSAKVNS